MKIPKSILLFAKLLQFISPKLAMLFAAKLFGTPFKHKIPKREFYMNENSTQTKVLISEINKEIVVYQYGNSNKKVLLVHGWSGRGTQLYKIADELLKNGYSTISFDAPAHGKSSGKTTLMPDFIASIHQLNTQFGGFEFVIGHSLGGMATLNALKEGLKIKKAVVIGSGNKVLDIFADFISKLKLSKKVLNLLVLYFEKKASKTMDSLSAYIVSKEITVPVLIIHDNKDDEIPVECAYEIHKNLKGSELLITEKLGHRKILGDKVVIEKIINYLKN